MEQHVNSTREQDGFISMKVKYDSSMWKQKGILNGKAQKANWYFEHKGLKRCIPCFYRFPRGVVFDILTFLDDEAVQAYFDKYKDIEDELTQSERITAERESPYKEIDIEEIYVNGVKIESGFSSSTLNVLPFSDEEECANPVRDAYREPLKNTACFICQRFKVHYPAASVIGKLRGLLRLNKISSLKIVTAQTQAYFSIDASAVLTENEPCAQLCFHHPVDGIDYTLHLQKSEDIEIPAHNRQEKFHFTAALYEIQPPLPQHQRLQFDNSIDYSMQPAPMRDCSCASSIGIIGGADGPTVIFGADNAAAQTGAHGLPLQSCISKIALCKQNEAEFCVQGIYLTSQDSETFIFEN